MSHAAAKFSPRWTRRARSGLGRQRVPPAFAGAQDGLYKPGQVDYGSIDIAALDVAAPALCCWIRRACCGPGAATTCTVGRHRRRPDHSARQREPAGKVGPVAATARRPMHLGGGALCPGQQQLGQLGHVLPFCSVPGVPPAPGTAMVLVMGGSLFVVAMTGDGPLSGNSKLGSWDMATQREDRHRPASTYCAVKHTHI